MQQRPDDAKTIHVPCVIFDGKSEDFATEMFVIINSTPTRINKSHLVDLYEKVSWAAPDKKFAARVVDHLYREGDIPLRYKINRLGGRSQAGEVDPPGRAVQRDPPLGHRATGSRSRRSRAGSARPSATTRSCATSCAPPRRRGATRGATPSYMVTRPVTLKAMLRVCADLAARRRRPDDERVEALGAPARRRGAISRRQFRVEGFYERFPAKGQVERVARIHRELARAANIERRGKSEDTED